MRKISNLLSSTNSKLIIPSQTVTVGPTNCDYSSLEEATLNSAEGSCFLIYSGTYDGIIYMKKNYDFTFLGRSILKQSADEYLFKFFGHYRHFWFYGYDRFLLCRSFWAGI